MKLLKLDGSSRNQLTVWEQIIFTKLSYAC